MFYLSQSSIDALQSVDIRLQKVIRRAFSYQRIDFTITEGLRTKERQKKLFDEGKTRTMNSKHLTGHAIDIHPYVAGVGLVTKYTSPYWDILATVIKIASIEEGYPLTWGGDWKSFVDKPHWELTHIL